MPTKKKTTSHPKKKVETTPKVEEPKQESKADRPVMQVVQVPEEETASAETPQPVVASVTPAVEKIASVTQTAPVVAPVAPSQPEEPETSVVTSDKKETPAEKPAATVVSSTVTPQTTTAPTVSSTPVASETFAEELPPVKGSSKKGLIAFLVILLLVVCGGVGGYLYMKGSLKLPATVTTLLNMKKPVAQVTVVPTSAVVPTPTPAAVDKSKYTIEVLNGSGVSGEAAKVKSSLTAAGYTVASTGNAATADFTQTEISAKVSVDSAFVNALRADLSKTYAVSSNLVALPTQAAVDVIVTIGSQTAQ